MRNRLFVVLILIVCLCTIACVDPNTGERVADSSNPEAPVAPENPEALEVPIPTTPSRTTVLVLAAGDARIVRKSGGDSKPIGCTVPLWVNTRILYLQLGHQDDYSFYSGCMVIKATDSVEIEHVVLGNGVEWFEWRNHYKLKNGL